MSNELEKAIRYFKNMRDDNKVVLDSGFGMKKGESNLFYKNRKKYAELAIEALEKQIAKKVIYENYAYICPICGGIVEDEDKCRFDYCPDCGQKLLWEE